MQHHGSMTHPDRELLHRTAEAIAPLPHPECRDLAGALNCLSQGSTRQSTVQATLELGTRVHQTLLSEASPDRWLPDVQAMGVTDSDVAETIAGLVDERASQARLVADALAVCGRMLQRLTPVPA